MREKLILLEASIRGDLGKTSMPRSAIKRSATIRPKSGSSSLPYRLHNLYTAFENIFHNIAISFENTLDDRSGWHRQLLQRMRLDLSPVRPAVIAAAAYEALDELLRFRHLFRSAYSARLDASRLALVMRSAQSLRPLYRPQIERFLDCVRTDA
jgi:hypothetical protein